MSYFEPALDPTLELVRKRSRAIVRRGVNFDTFVGTGFSGTLPLYGLAKKFKVNALAVRKTLSGTHSSYLLEGTLGRRWVFLDDFISSGETFLRVYKAIVKRDGDGSQCVGAFCYASHSEDWWIPFENIPHVMKADVYRREFKELLGSAAARRDS